MLKDLCKANRSYRSFDGSYVISRETLLELVDCTRYCPSSVNLQPFVYVLSCDEETNQKIFPLTAWARMLPDFQGPPEGHRPTAYIVVCTNREVGPNVERFRADVGIVSQTMMLAAVEKGLGGCMIGNYSPEEVSKVLKLPDNLFPSLILALGKPDEEIVLVDLEQGQDSRYYRKEGIHYVPKRKLEDIVRGI